MDDFPIEEHGSYPELVKALTSHHYITKTEFYTELRHLRSQVRLEQASGWGASSIVVLDPNYPTAENGAGHDYAVIYRRYQ